MQRSKPRSHVSMKVSTCSTHFKLPPILLGYPTWNSSYTHRFTVLKSFTPQNGADISHIRRNRQNIFGLKHVISKSFWAIPTFAWIVESWSLCNNLFSTSIDQDSVKDEARNHRASCLGGHKSTNLQSWILSMAEATKSKSSSRSSSKSPWIGMTSRNNHGPRRWKVDCN